MANKITYGVNTIELNFAGCEAKDVAAQCSQILCLTGEEDMKVNGNDVQPNYVIKDGDTIAFRKDAGTKGSEDVVVTVQHGVNRVEVHVSDGSTVRDVLRQAAAIIGIDLDNGTPVLNGAEVRPDAHVHAGDKVECRKDAGTKGC